MQGNAEFGELLGIFDSSVAGSVLTISISVDESTIKKLAAVLGDDASSRTTER